MRFFLTIALLTIATSAAAGQNLLFILDASGSMWGRIDGTPKISVAKEVMSGLVEDLPDNAKAGLTAYGHRRKGDCTDIESLVGLGPLDRDTLIERIQGLNPKGKTPITAAVKQAIGQLRQVEESASVVLVSDGLESCGGDPCEAVKAAKKSGVDFTLHVVGFDLGDTDTGQLQCMADAGGGQFFTAANADELTGALKKAVEIKPGLVLTVVSNGESTPARATAFSAATRESAREKVKTVRLGKSGEGKPANPRRIALSPGSYEVEVEATALSGDRQKTLTELAIPKEGEVARTIDFSDGAIELMVTSNDKPINAYTYVYKAGTKNEVAREHTGGDGLARYELAPGDYDIKIRPRGISAPNRRVEGITVSYGETTQESVDYATGTAQLTVTTNGEPLNARTYIQHSDSHEEAARSGTNDQGVADYTIPVGNYRIQVRPDGISAPDQFVKDVIVTAGETTKKSLDIASGTAQLTVTTNGEPLGARTYVQHSDSHEEAARGWTNDQGMVDYTIPVGSYRIQVRPTGISAPDEYVEDVTVKAGQTTKTSIDIVEPGADDG